MRITERRRAAHAATDHTPVWQTVVLTLCILVGLAAVGSWARPWRFAAANPNLDGVATATTSGQVVGGCPVGGSRNEINCTQYVDFEAGQVQIRHGAVHVTDGFRHGPESADNVTIVYDRAHPSRFRLADGNPGTSTRVLGTAWMSFVMILGGLLGGVLLGEVLVVALSRIVPQPISKHGS